MSAAFLTAAGGLLGSYLDFRSNQRTNNTNYNIATNTNNANMLMNQQNIEMQERENAINRAREDDAVRRRANDLVGAGLSKTLAAGSPASANAMQAPSNQFEMQSPRMQAYTNFGKNFNDIASNVETAAYHRRQAEIADKELDVREQELDEAKRHNEATEEHAKAVLEVEKDTLRLQNFWKRMEYNQNSMFHDDAMKIDWARTRIDYLGYLNEVDKTEIQNTWYTGQLELQKAAGERDAARLTAELSEMSAKTAMYLKDIQLSNAQISLLEKQGKLVIAESMESLARKKHYNAQTKGIMIDNVSKVWNLLLSVKGESKTNQPDVTPAQANENALDRTSSMHRTLVTVGAGALGVGLGAFMKTGGGFLVKKMLGLDDHSQWYKDL